MSGQVRQFVAERWRFGILQARTTLEELVRHLNTNLGKLSETFERVQQSVENGPVPGAYFPVPMYCDTPAIEDDIARTYLPRSYQGFRLLSCAASISGQSDASAELDIEVEYFDANTSAWASLLTSATQTVTFGTPVQLNSAGDFTDSYYAGTAVRVNCTDMTNIPKGLMVLLSLKNVGKIEPVTS